MKAYRFKLSSKVFVISAIFIASCSNPADDAETQYEIVKRTGDKQEICNKAKELAAIYLREKDEEKYKYQKLVADIECQAADQERRGL